MCKKVLRNFTKVTKSCYSHFFYLVNLKQLNLQNIHTLHFQILIITFRRLRVDHTLPENGYRTKVKKNIFTCTNKTKRNDSQTFRWLLSVCYPNAMSSVQRNIIQKFKSPTSQKSIKVCQGGFEKKKATE